MASYYLAPSLAVLRREIDARWPGRDRKSDGWIGDAAHQARPSDHNPNARGSVNAIDVDRDGIDPAAIIAAFEAHPSAQYWIFNRTIANRAYGWGRRAYTGDNPHTGHVHLSIRQSADAEQDTRPWGVATARSSDEEVVVETVKIMQAGLRDLGHDPGPIDGEPGPKTLSALASLMAEKVNGYQYKDGKKLYSSATGGEHHARDAAIAAAAIQEQLTELADRPAPTVDVDQLAAAMVRQLLALVAAPSGSGE